MNPINVPERVRLANMQALSGVVGGAQGSTGIEGGDYGSAINSEMLRGGSALIKLPQQNPATSAVGLSGLAESIGQSAQRQAELDRNATLKETELNKSRTDLEQLRKDIEGVQTSRTRLNEQFGVDQKMQDVSKYTNQLEALTRAETNELRALDSAGLTDAQRNARKAEVQRQYAFQKADVALLQSAANRDLATAQSIIDKRIETDLEPLKTRLDFFKLAYEDNRDLYTKAEQRAFDARTKQEERIYETQKAEKTAIADLQKKLIEGMIDGKIPYSDSLISQVGRAGTLDEANRLLSGIKTTTTGNQYSTTQSKAIDQIDTGVSNSFAYKAVNSAKGFADGVVSSLQQGNGLGDIAAINQFQKVIDEGAVTRDQDVKLVQSAQSLADKLKLQIKKLQKGEQLSPTQRAEMQTAVKALYEAKVRSLLDDPYIKAQTLKAERNGIDVNDTILGQLGVFGAGQSIPAGTDGSAYGFPGYVSDGTQWVLK